MKVVIFAGRAFHQQGRTFRVQLVQRLAELFALRFLHLEALHHDQLAIGQLGRQRRAQRAQQLLARESVIVRAGLRSVDRAAVPPQWRANGAHARAPGALLLPQLLTCAAHQLLVLGGVGTGTLSGAIVPHRFPQQVLVHRAKNFIGQFQGTYLFAAEIHYINRRHSFFRFNLSVASCYFFFAEARLDAFNGSTVPAPLNPRRSLGGFLAFAIITYASLCPGTAPSTTSRFSSLSTPSTRTSRSRP